MSAFKLATCPPANSFHSEHRRPVRRSTFREAPCLLPLLTHGHPRRHKVERVSSGTLRLSGQSVYGMTKCALDYLTQSLAGELAPDRIRVNCIAPGPIDTPIHATWADDLEEAYRWLKGQVPLGRIGDPDEIARWIALLLSPVSSFLTGAVIPVDGGQVIPHS